MSSLTKQKNHDILIDLSLSLKQLKIDMESLKTDISHIKNDLRVKTIKDMVEEPKVNTTKKEEYDGGWRLW
jgi:hypothetical protein